MEEKKRTGEERQQKKNRIRKWGKKAAEFLFNPRFLFCFGLGWIITNGWSYILMGIGTYFQIGWMISIAGAYLAFLWLPVSPEKLVTLAIAITLLKWLFPNDKKTLAILKELNQKAKDALQKRKRKKEEKSQLFSDRDEYEKHEAKKESEKG